VEAVAQACFRVAVTIGALKSSRPAGQGRFKGFSAQSDERSLTGLRSVEANPVRANRVPPQAGRGLVPLEGDIARWHGPTSVRRTDRETRAVAPSGQPTVWREPRGKPV